MAKKEINEEIRPITLRDKESGETYTLEFDRDAIKFAESRNFDIDDVGRLPYIKTVELFWYAFRMHHKSVSLEKAERILTQDLGGMPDGMMERLAQLYSKPFDALVQTEETVKNAKMTVEM